MLGEDHSLTKDFPDYTQTIAKLNANDENCDLAPIKL